jgi:hypothetical protein
VAAARVCVLSMSELEMVDAAVGMGCELTIISLTIFCLGSFRAFHVWGHYARYD